MASLERGLTLLGPILLQNDEIVQLSSRVARALRTSYGWHYHLDFVWTVESLLRAGVAPGARVLDAGAGNGILQFLLASLGYHVVSVDYSDRLIARRMRLGYRISNVATSERFSHSYLEHIGRGTGLSSGASQLPKFDLGVPWLLWNRMSGRGSITRMRADMRDMHLVSSGSVDAVVSISAIEHMKIEDISSAITEFRRVLRPKAPIVLTTSASAGETWFHEASQGLCFSQSDLSALFGVPQHWGDYATTLQAIRESETLRSLLHPSYFLSGSNGMPWGVWEPKYVPVGVIA